MADTKKTLSALQTLFANNTTGDISAQDIRDFLVTVYGSWTTTSKTYANSPYTNSLDDVVLIFDGTSGAIVHNLVGNEGKILIVQATGGNYVTVTAQGAETIAGASTFVVPSGSYSIFCKIGSVWSVFSPLATNGNLVVPGLFGTTNIYLGSGTGTSLTRTATATTLRVGSQDSIQIASDGGYVGIGGAPNNSDLLKVHGTIVSAGIDASSGPVLASTVGSGIFDDASISFANTTDITVGAYSSAKIGFFGKTPAVQQTKASHNNWAALSDVVSALVNLGLLDQA